MTEPTGHTIDGTPWEEPRPPHLPDPVTGVARRVPVAAWVFIALAVVISAFRLRDLVSVLQVGSLGDVGVQGVASLIVGAVQPVATCLFGAALLIRHPRAWLTDRRVVIGVTILVVAELMQVARSPIGDVLLTVFPADETVNPTSSPGLVVFWLLTGAMSAFGLLYLALGLAEARERPDPGSGRGRALVLGAVVLVTIVAELSSIAVSWTQATSEAVSTWTLVYLVGVAVVTSVATASLAYVTATASTGLAAGERPTAGWRNASIGLWVVLLVGMVLSLTFAYGSRVTVDQGLSDTLTTVIRLAGYALAAGYLLVLAGFVAGLPRVDGAEPADADADDDGGAPAGPEGSVVRAYHGTPADPDERADPEAPVILAPDDDRG